MKKIPVKRSIQTTSANVKDDDETESIHSQSSTRNSKRLRNPSGSSLPTYSKQNVLQEMYDMLKTYRSPIDNRVLCESFMKLPSKRSHADYFTIVKEPIDMLQIQAKIKSDEYPKYYQDFDADFNLLISNAKLYYKKAMQEYKDACLLLEVYENEKKKKFVDTSLNDESIDLVDQEETSTATTRKSRARSNANNLKNSPAKIKLEETNEDSLLTSRRSAESPNTRKKLNTSASPSSSSILNTTTNLKQDQQLNISLMSYLEDFFYAIATFKCPETKRSLAIVFYMLPSAKLYPDYYQTIQKPIDLKTIAKRIKTSQYKTLKQIESDLILMTDNAKRYNDPKSIIYKDACKLKRLIQDLCKTLTKLMQQGKHYESDSDDTHKKGKLVEQLSELSQADFNKKLAEAEAEALQLDSLNTTAKIRKEKKPKQKIEEDDEEEDDDDDDDDDEDEYDDEENTDSIKKENEINSLEESSKCIESLSGKRNHPLMIAMWSLFDYVKEIKNSSDQTLIDPFIKLPSKRIYPDYFEEIKQPISLNQIKSKLNKRLYKSLNDFNKDFTLMFTNAMQYNVEESIIYSNAKTLMEAFKQKSAELAATDIGDLVVMSKNLNDNSNPALNIGSTPSKQKKINEPSLLSSAIKKTYLYDKLPKFNDLRDKLQYLYNYMSDYQIDQRELAYPFRHLPSKLEYPDYYNIIKKPIDMNKILHKITQVGKCTDYTSIDEMCLDFAQMFENACIYNEPSSTIYKDALNMQRALFIKRDEIYKQDAELGINSEWLEEIPANFIINSVQDIIQQLFTSCMQYQDNEGRLFADSFLQLYVMLDNDCSNDKLDLITLEYMQKRVEAKTYKRLDVFQEEMFLFFNQIRSLSYIDGDYKLKRDQSSVHGNTSHVIPEHRKIHRYSQLYRDTYELQRYFIQKRDELCKNGELLQSSALNFKLNALDSHLSMTIGGQTFDEAEALLVDKRFKILEAKLDTDNEVKNDQALTNLSVGNYFYMSKKLVMSNLEPNVEHTNNDDEEMLVVCVLATNKTKTKFIVQPYLRPNDDLIDSDLRRVRKFFTKEIFKSDLYALITVNEKVIFKTCFVISIKDYLNNQISIGKRTKTVHDVNANVSIDDDLFVCESMYSTFHKYFRKLNYKKWQPLKFIGINNIEDESVDNTETNDLKLDLVKRVDPFLLERKFLEETIVKTLRLKIEQKLDEFKCLPIFFKQFYSDTVQYDSPPARFKEEKEPDEIVTAADLNLNQNTIEEDAELMKTAKYYEQLVYSDDNEIYKIGDHVYVVNNQLINTQSKQPLIVRIDRLWSIETNSNESGGEMTKKYYMRGPLFLRPIDIEHEPTRLFYTNEVFREQSREITVSLDQTTSGTSSGSKKCVVMSNKKYVSSRITEIDERDVYLCEAKYSLQMKAFRKFTKGMRKVELSVKCFEDEVYFLKRELQLKKNLSPILVNLTITYEESDYPMSNSNFDANIGNENSNDYVDDDEDDESSNQNDTDSMKLSKMTPGTPSYSISVKKIRQKRDKKSAYNIFSKEFRKSLRDTKSSLSFELMSKEVGNRWRALTPQQRAEYEEKARIETIKEMKKVNAERAAQEAQQLQLHHQQQQQQAYSQGYSNNLAPQVHTNHINHILATQSAAQQQQHQQHQIINGQTMYLNTNGLVQQLPQYAQQQAQQTTQPIIMYQVQPQMYQQQQQQQSQLVQQAAPLPAVQQPPQTLGPRQVQHKEAYIKYISNIRKQQHLNQGTGFYHNLNQPAGDWHNSIDVRTSRIKESKVMPPPSAWIENCESNDVLKHLVSLRYYMLNDAVNIKRNHDEDKVDNQMVVDEQNVENEIIETPVLLEL